MTGPLWPTGDPELAEIEEAYPGWHLWRWNNQVYARRLMSSPPIVISRPTAAEIRTEIEKR